MKQATMAFLDDREHQTLEERFIVPPFSILDARAGYWQDRKRAWLRLGIKSEVGRNKDIVPNGAVRSEEQDGCYSRAMGSESAGGSIFDPVLCELAYSWFTAPGFAVLDPFAGGSVRGIVAAKLGRFYHGCDLRHEQIEANRQQWADIGDGPAPEWVAGDSVEIASLLPGEYDLIFSCPPYADLEVYSDDPADLSSMDYPEFLEAYREIIAESVGLLKPNRFACFVVGEVRDKRGNYRGLVPDTIQAFQDAGCTYYNEMVLVTAVGSLPLRAGKIFDAGRKIGKTHQNVLVFVKGDARAAADACGVVQNMGAPVWAGGA